MSFLSAFEISRFYYIFRGIFAVFAKCAFNDAAITSLVSNSCALNILNGLCGTGELVESKVKGVMDLQETLLTR